MVKYSIRLAIMGLVVAALVTGIGWGELTQFCGGQTEVVLKAAQWMDVGLASVSNDEGILHVTYSTAGDWVITEVHLAIAPSPDLFPQTRSGNPRVGRFALQAAFDPPVTEWTFDIDLESQGYQVGDLVYVAAHATVQLWENGLLYQEETAWGEGEPFGGRNWAMYFSHEVQPCFKEARLPEGKVKMKEMSYYGPVSYFTTKLDSVPAGDYDVTNGLYPGWSADQFVYIPAGMWFRPFLRSSYDPPEHAAAIDWPRVNYILNNTHPGATWLDIQMAIWFFTDGGAYPVDPEAQAMVDEALANGEGYHPGEGGIVAVICDLGAGEQLTFIEVDP